MPKQTDTVPVDPAEDLPALVAAQAVEIERLRVALKLADDYTFHLPNCAWRKRNCPPCSCGFDDANMKINDALDNATIPPAPQPATPELSEYAARMVEQGRKP